MIIIMTEEECGYLVDLINYSQDHYLSLMEIGSDHVRHRTWLHFLGLLETWDMLHDR